ncbi:MULTISPECIES: hypothetical protein [Streptomyces]|uniref:hypothetical protein n=1 Tax=Streptomyces TaxID=1883 RepID=UPI0018DF4BC8|nr:MULTISPECIES: hypothetical protein [Streptomyces]MCZ4103391.1 hypothetical protein [Streptomyces sp. H39-C1]
MADGFDINDRSTWDWVNGRDVSFVGFTGGDCLLNPVDAGSFFQRGENDIAVFQSCQGGAVFHAKVGGVGAGLPGFEVDNYDWAVSNGLVNDQR